MVCFPALMSAIASMLGRSLGSPGSTAAYGSARPRAVPVGPSGLYKGAYVANVKELQLKLRLEEKVEGGAPRRIVKLKNKSYGNVYVYGCAHHQYGCEFSIRAVRQRDDGSFRIVDVKASHHPECWSFGLLEVQRRTVENLPSRRAGPGTTSMVCGWTLEVADPLLGEGSSIWRGSQAMA
jgi:hypothetical protein